MCRTWTIIFWLSTLALGGETPLEHRDYVPDEKTAVRIAEAVLVGQYGQGRVNPQLPLHADGSNKDYWLVQGYVRKDPIPPKATASPCGLTSTRAAFRKCSSI